MKHIVITAIVVLMTFVGVTGCDTVGRYVGGAQQVSSQVVGVDFRAGEQLVSESDRDGVRSNYYKAARIVVQPSAATQDQAEVIFADGTRRWARYVLETRKATRADMRVGRVVLHMRHTSARDNINQDTYRNTRWHWGRVTSVDELFRGRAEVDGTPMNLDWLRLSDVIVE